jgi:hypothetical protein
VRYDSLGWMNSSGAVAFFTFLCGSETLLRPDIYSPSSGEKGQVLDQDSPEVGSQDSPTTGSDEANTVARINGLVGQLSKRANELDAVKLEAETARQDADALRLELAEARAALAAPADRPSRPVLNPGKRPIEQPEPTWADYGIEVSGTKVSPFPVTDSGPSWKDIGF